MKEESMGRVMIQNALRPEYHKSCNNIAVGSDSQFPDQEVSFLK